MPSRSTPSPTIHRRRVNGVVLADRAGAAPAIVFVHGLAVSSRYFVPTLRVLADRSRCSAVDLTEFTALLVDARPVEIPGGAHVVNFIRPDEVARKIHTFLRDGGAR